MTGLTLGAVLLLIGAGIAKILSPGHASQAIAGARLTLPTWARAHAAVRLLGVVELLLGAAVIGTNHWLPAAALAGCYLMLGLFAARLRAAGPQQSCGCFGERSEPVGVSHIAVCAAGAAIGAVAAATTSESLVSQLSALGAIAAPIAIAGAVLAYVAYLSMTDLPRLMNAVRRLEVSA